jgi:hypothetical protein
MTKLELMFYVIAILLGIGLSYLDFTPKPAVNTFEDKLIQRLDRMNTIEAHENVPMG